MFNSPPPSGASRTNKNTPKATTFNEAPNYRWPTASATAEKNKQLRDAFLNAPVQNVSLEKNGAVEKSQKGQDKAEYNFSWYRDVRKHTLNKNITVDAKPFLLPNYLKAPDNSKINSALADNFTTEQANGVNGQTSLQTDGKPKLGRGVQRSVSERVPEMTRRYAAIASTRSVYKEKVADMAKKKHN